MAEKSTISLNNYAKIIFKGFNDWVRGVEDGIYPIDGHLYCIKNGKVYPTSNRVYDWKYN